MEYIRTLFGGLGMAANGQAHVQVGHQRQQSKLNLAEKLPFAAQAAFNSCDEQLCLPETRVDVLRQIIAWADGDDERCIFWLNGVAGTGKSTIARTVASIYYNQERLGASFFFSRRGGDVSHSGKFVTTIAVQLAENSTEIKRVVCKAITQQSNIVRQSLCDQWNHLILEPLSQLDADFVESPLLVVVDALDECDDGNDIESILHLLAGVRCLQKARLRIFFTSRPDIPIRRGFYNIPESERQDCVLHNISQPTINHDISVFFKYHFEIISRECHLDANWPGEQTIGHLVQEAGGSFTWAALACGFIQEGRGFAKQRLAQILKQNTSTIPEEKLDSIYTAILANSIRDEHDDKEKKEWSRRLIEILGAIAILLSSLSPISLARLLHLPKNHIYQALDDMRCILEVPEDPGHPIRFHHPSFRNFLLNKERCRNQLFQVNEEAAHQALAEKCLRLMSDSLRRNICDLQTPCALASEVKGDWLEHCLPAELQYACCSWVQHLQRSNAHPSDRSGVHVFLRKHLLHWLEALCLIGKIPESLDMMANLQSTIADRNPDLLAIVNDARRFILYSRLIIEKSPLQIYCSALIFAPKKSVVRSQFFGDLPRWISNQPRVVNDWGPSLQVLEGHLDAVTAIAFSPGCQLLASASDDCTVRLWNPFTGASHGILTGHLLRVNSVAFSPDGRLLASASYDHIVRLWDPATGALRGTLKGHSAGIRAVAFSPDCQLLASASDDHTVRLWKPSTGALHNTLKGHSDEVHAVAFSPDGQLLASSSNDCTVMIWASSTGASRGIGRGHLAGIYAVVFSPDGKLLASASHDHTVRLWDSATGTPCSTNSTLESHLGRIHAIAFSPDSQLLASASDDCTVIFWDPATGISRAILKGHSDWVRAVAFSPDGQLLASSSDDCTVRLWNPVTKEPQVILKGHLDWVRAIAFSANGQLLASASDDCTIRLWHPARGTSRYTLKGHSGQVRAVAFSPDGKLLASASDDRTVGLWDPVTGAYHGALKGHLATVNAVAFSPDSRLLASASDDCTVRLRDRETSTVCGILEGHSSPVRALAFSPDCEYLASASDDHTIGLWRRTERETWVWVGNLRDHLAAVHAVAFSPDSRLLASASKDCKVILWNVGRREAIRTLDTKDRISALSFSRDSSCLETNLGLLELNRPNHPDSGFQINAISPLYANGDWLTWRGEKILWLPPEYRPNCVGFRQNILAIGHASGRVTFVEVDPRWITTNPSAHH